MALSQLLGRMPKRSLPVATLCKNKPPWLPAVFILNVTHQQFPKRLTPRCGRPDKFEMTNLTPADSLPLENAAPDMHTCPHAGTRLVARGVVVLSNLTGRPHLHNLIRWHFCGRWMHYFWNMPKNTFNCLLPYLPTAFLLRLLSGLLVMFHRVVPVHAHFAHQCPLA